MEDAHLSGLRLAVVAIGAIHVGIPAAAVVQALPAPGTPALLPRRQGALCGVVDHDGMLVPVVDLARWVDVGTAPPAPGRPQPRIVVLRHGGRVIGVRVDGVGGLVDVAPDTVQRLHHDDDADEVFHSAVRAPGSEHILSLLDVDRLARLAAAWNDGAAGAAIPEPATAGNDNDAPRIAPYALLRAGDVRLAVPAGDLAEVVAMPALERFGGGVKGAFCMWRGRHLPVVEPGMLAPATPQTAGLLAVLEHEGLALGVPVHAALQLGTFDPDAARPYAIATTVYDADGAVQLVDTAALFARCPEAALSRPDGTACAPAGNGTAPGAANDTACIVFEADGMGAAPIDTVEQVLPLAGPVDATMPWEGKAIAVVDLRPEAARAGGGHVLVVRGALGRVACVVTRLHLLIPAGSGRLYRMGAAGGRPLQFITTGEGAGQASYRMVDLAA